MPNDFESRALQRLLGLNQETVESIGPPFLNTVGFLPGVSGPDEQLQSLIGLTPDIFAGLAALFAPPEIEADGTTLPQIQNTGLVRPRQPLPQRSQPTKRTKLQERQRDAQRMEARRRLLETQRKKGIK